MGQTQRHRGQHPEDARLFGEAWIPRLREAVADLSHLLSRGYAADSSLKLIGDRFQLDVRQRRAIQRAACPDTALARRAAHRIPLEALRGEAVCIDGYNLLITVESVFAGGVLLRGRDGCIRDMASLHGSYHKVGETIPAVEFVGTLLMELGVAEAQWFFDKPVSNSGHLRAMLEVMAREKGWPWRVDVSGSTDRVVAESHAIAITTDSWILDRAVRWAHLMDASVEKLGLREKVIDLA